MANRSDYQAKLPRRFKRMLSLSSTGDPHRDGEIRRIFISAHCNEIEVRNKKMRAKFGSGEVVDDATQEALTANNEVI